MRNLNTFRLSKFHFINTLNIPISFYYLISFYCHLILIISFYNTLNIPIFRYWWTFGRANSLLERRTLASLLTSGSVERTGKSSCRLRLLKWKEDSDSYNQNSPDNQQAFKWKRKLQKHSSLLHDKRYHTWKDKWNWGTKIKGSLSWGWCMNCLIMVYL